MILEDKVLDDGVDDGPRGAIRAETQVVDSWRLTSLFHAMLLVKSRLCSAIKMDMVVFGLTSGVGDTDQSWEHFGSSSRLSLASVWCKDTVAVLVSKTWCGMGTTKQMQLWRCCRQSSRSPRQGECHDIDRAPSNRPEMVRKENLAECAVVANRVAEVSDEARSAAGRFESAKRNRQIKSPTEATTMPTG